MLQCQMTQEFTTSPRLERQIGSRCTHGASVHSQPQRNGSAQRAVCVASNPVTEKHACNSGAIETLSALMLMLTASTEVLVMTMSCTQSNPWTGKQLKVLPANVSVSSELLQTQRFACPLPRTRIKPPLRHPLMMT